VFILLQTWCIYLHVMYLCKLSHAQWQLSNTDFRQSTNLILFFSSAEPWMYLYVTVLLKVSFETVCNAEPPESNLSVFCLLLLRVNCVSISMHEVQWRHWMEHKSILEVYIMWTGRERVKLQKLEILKPKLSVDCIFLLVYIWTTVCKYNVSLLLHRKPPAWPW